MNSNVVPTGGTINDLVDQANDAMDKMSKDNPNRRLILTMARVIVGLADKFMKQSILLKEIQDHVLILLDEETRASWHPRINELLVPGTPGLPEGGKHAKES